MKYYNETTKLQFYLGKKGTFQINILNLSKTMNDKAIWQLSKAKGFSSTVL